MKKLLFLAVVVGGVALWGRATPQYAYWQLRAALEQGDVAAVEQYADLKALSGVAVDVLAAAGEQVAEDEGGKLAGTVTRLFGALLRAPLKEALGPAALDDLKASIGRKELAAGIGDFTFDGPLSGLTRVESFGTSAQVEVTGQCKGKPASVKLVFERRPDALVSFFAPYRAVGVERDSLKGLTKTCMLTVAK